MVGEVLCCFGGSPSFLLLLWTLMLFVLPSYPLHSLSGATVCPATRCCRCVISLLNCVRPLTSFLLWSTAEQILLLSSMTDLPSSPTFATRGSLGRSATAAPGNPSCKPWCRAITPFPTVMFCDFRGGRTGGCCSVNSEGETDFPRVLEL